MRSRYRDLFLRGARKRSIGWRGLALIVPLVGLGYGCGSDAKNDNGTPDASTTTKDIVATAQAAGSFTKLVAAVMAADLVDTLKGPGPFTVFAPNDAAFAKLPAGTVDTLLKPENKAMLQDILKYHVVAGKVLAADVVKLTEANTVEGKSVAITVSGSTVKVNDATVVQADVLASNGVIHVIDTVLLPAN